MKDTVVISVLCLVIVVIGYFASSFTVVSTKVVNQSLLDSQSIHNYEKVIDSIKWYIVPADFRLEPQPYIESYVSSVTGKRALLVGEISTFGNENAVLAGHFAEGKLEISGKMMSPVMDINVYWSAFNTIETLIEIPELGEVKGGNISNTFTIAPRGLLKYEFK